MEMSHASGTLGAAPGVMGAGAVAGLAGLPKGAPVAAVAGSAEVTLTELATGAVARVLSVSAPNMGGSPEIARRLAELGFLPGERLRIVARGLLGREPIAVRIGTGTFALRLFEAAYIRVAAEHLQRI
jgi:ferrous iron transport protein A